MSRPKPMPSPVQGRRLSLAAAVVVLLSLLSRPQGVRAYSFLRPGGILGRIHLLGGDHPPAIRQKKSHHRAITRPPHSSRSNHSQAHAHNPRRFTGSSPGDNEDSKKEPTTPSTKPSSSSPLKNGRFLPPTFPKDPEESNFIKTTLLTNFMFQSLPDKTLDRLVNAFEKVECSKRSVIIRQGDCKIDRMNFYVLQKGECSVTIDNKVLPDPYGTLSEGTVFGELGMLYSVPRAATITAETDCTLYQIDRRTFRYFISSQQPQDREDVKTELREIDTAIDKIAGVKTRYSGSIIHPFRPNRAWLWRRWTGTVLQHAYKGALWNMLITATISFFIGRRADCTWAVAMAPDKSNPIISRMTAFGQSWHYMMNLTTFILTFFLSQSYSLWREMYNTGRKIQGRLNDVGLLLATHAKRQDNGRYTPEAEAVLDDVASFSRLFHTFCWANYARNLRILLTPRGMSRMLSRGLMTQNDFNALQSIEQAGANNACLEWMVLRAFKGIEDGAIKDSESMEHALLAKISDLRGTYAGISDILDGRMPLAYAHFVQILVDSFLITAPVALYAELGLWSILSVGILTLFYSGLLDLAKIFLDPLGNDEWCKENVNMDIGVLIREGNAGSTRWKNGAAVVPF
mmetsp:Transcript_12922/g.27370  ORF Transcript_12922/g.27370 Transcript_12922/m.27370 type:complete len:629 (+) Transcript_12922:32-1918(+)